MIQGFSPASSTKITPDITLARVSTFETSWGELCRATSPQDPKGDEFIPKEYSTY
jgi:hypothetical protein